MQSNTRNIGLVIDSSCDVPGKYLKHFSISLLPNRVFAGGQVILDRRDATETRQFYTDCLNTPSAMDGRSEPLTTDEMVQAFDHELALAFDEVVGVFVASSRSAVFSRAQASLKEARIRSTLSRLRAGKSHSMDIACLDSAALFGGYAAQALCLLDAIDHGVGFQQLVDLQKASVERTYAYVAPGDVAYILERASRKGERSVSALSGFVAKAFSVYPILMGHKGETTRIGKVLGKANGRESVVRLALGLVQHGLITGDHICLSYSGDLAEVSSVSNYTRLTERAAEKGIQVHLTEMSMTASVNVGPQALSVGFLADPHDASAHLK